MYGEPSMKKILLLFCIFCLCLSLFACKEGEGGEITSKTVVGNYIWEKEGFGGPFNIYLKKDGTCNYYVGYLSSYFGTGTWSLEAGIVTIVETKESSGFDHVFHFRAEKDALVFIGEGSDQFMYTVVNDGDKFLRSEVEGE